MPRNRQSDNQAVTGHAFPEFTGTKRATQPARRCDSCGAWQSVYRGAKETVCFACRPPRTRRYERMTVDPLHPASLVVRLQRAEAELEHARGALENAAEFLDALGETAMAVQLRKDAWLGGVSERAA